MAPTYEYECQKCGHQFEKFQGIKDDPVKRCPKCRCKVRRLLGSGAGIIFKGSGFYETDYKRKVTPPSEGGSSSSSRSSSSKSESKTDSKPSSSGTKETGKNSSK